MTNAATVVTTRHWVQVSKANRQARRMADRHYSFWQHHNRPMSHEVGPPGQKIILLTADSLAVWGSHRPAPWAGIPRADGFEGATCFLYRNEGYESRQSSDLIREAVAYTCHRWGPSRFLTYVAVEKVRSSNPGYSYLCAGFEHDGYTESAKLGKLRRLIMPEAAVLFGGIPDAGVIMTVTAAVMQTGLVAPIGLERTLSGCRALRRK